MAPLRNDERTGGRHLRRKHLPYTEKSIQSWKKKEEERSGGKRTDGDKADKMHVEEGDENPADLCERAKGDVARDSGAGNAISKRLSRTSRIRIRSRRRTCRLPCVNCHRWQERCGVGSPRNKESLGMSADGNRDQNDQSRNGEERVGK